MDRGRGGAASVIRTVAPSRRLVALQPAVQVRYVSLVAAVAPDVESACSGAVAANRVAEASVRPPVLRLRPWHREHEVFRRALARLCHDARCLAVADVRACYRSISPRVVETALLDARCHPGPAAAVAAFLRRLEHHLGVRGLPVGPEPSAVLANAVLAHLDRALADAGLRHLRWVDDVVIAADAPTTAREALDLIRSSLRHVGLELNEGKTRVVTDPVAVTAGSFSAPGAAALLG